MLSRLFTEQTASCVQYDRIVEEGNNKDKKPMQSNAARKAKTAKKDGSDDTGNVARAWTCECWCRVLHHMSSLDMSNTKNSEVLLWDVLGSI